MQNIRLHHARRFWAVLAATIGLGLLTGCDDVKITNLTPGTLPVNPSQTYTFSARIEVKTSGYVEGTLDPTIIIDGRPHRMTPSPMGPDIYEYDHPVTADRTELRYYFLVNYEVFFNNRRMQREAYTGLQTATLASRFILSLEANRGPVGARVGVMGRGFTPEDVVYVGGTPARTVFESPNALSFFVPALPPARNYEVDVGGTAGTKRVGTFRVDSVGLTVTPTGLNLRRGQRQTLVFTLPNPAPTGGLLLDVTTDVPESVIMPEVLIPAGQTQVAITVEGGAPGTGSLYLQGFGVGEITIPVEVR
jgi:hypothetical protein